MSEVVEASAVQRAGRRALAAVAAAVVNAVLSAILLILAQPVAGPWLPPRPIQLSLWSDCEHGASVRLAGHSDEAGASVP